MTTGTISSAVNLHRIAAAIASAATIARAGVGARQKRSDSHAAASIAVAAPASVPTRLACARMLGSSAYAQTAPLAASGPYNRRAHRNTIKPPRHDHGIIGKRDI